MCADVKVPDKNTSNTPLITVFSDGACSGNPGPGGWGAIIGDAREVVELGGGAASTTNNRMELTAAIQALKFIREKNWEGSIKILTDSKYVIQGITQWIHGWKKKDWKTKDQNGDVKNRDLWEKLDHFVSDLRSRSQKIEWDYVPGHSGIAANERCDEIAVAFTSGESVPLFHGPRAEYSISLEVSPDQIIDKLRLSKPESKTNKADLYYLSYVGGRVYRDKAWSQCEARVKGHRGAKYQKCFSPEEEKEILKKWGVSGE